MLSEEIRLALEDKQDEILTGMPVPQDGKEGDLRTLVTHKGKFSMAMKSGGRWLYSPPFSRTPPIRSLEDYLPLSGGKMLDGSKIEIDEIRARDSDGLWLREDGGTKGLQVLDSGYVYVTDRMGIGVVVPVTKMHISKTITDTPTVGVGQLVLSEPGDDSYGLWLAYSYDSRVAFIAAGKSGVAYNNIVIPGGNVGIGTNTVPAKLSFGTTSTIGTATSDGSDNDVLTIASTGAAGSARGAYIQLSGNERTSHEGRLTLVAGNDAAFGHMTVDAGGSERMRIEYGGNVGIGTASPGEKLTLDNGTLLFQNNGGLCFGEIYVADASDTITITTAGKANKVQITSFAANGASNGSVTPDHTNDHITVGKAGHYFCVVSMHVLSTGGGSADNIGYSVYKNNGATEFSNLHGQRDLAGGGGDEGSIGISGIIDCAANDTIEVWIWNNTNNDDIVVDDINLSLFQIGGT